MLDSLHSSYVLHVVRLINTKRSFSGLIFMLVYHHKNVNPLNDVRGFDITNN